MEHHSKKSVDHGGAAGEKSSSQSAMLSLTSEQFLEEDARQLLDVYQESYAEIQKELQKPNVLITGITGSGKSSFINALFGQNFAKVGSGTPITQHFDRYAPADKPIVLYDSKGLESGKATEFVETTRQFFESHKKTNTGNITDCIHVVWYIVNSAMARFQDFEVEICKSLFQHVPIVFILNKADISTESERAALRKIIEDMNLDNCFGVIETIANPRVTSNNNFDKCPECESEEIVIRRKTKMLECESCGHSLSVANDNGLAKVIKTTIKILPVLAKDSFIAAQSVSFHLKEDQAKKVLLESEKDFERVRGKGSLVKITAKMLTRLSIIWQFREHGNLYGVDVAQHLVSSFTFRDSIMLFIHKHQSQKNHAIALGILWNRCVRSLAMEIFNDITELGDEIDRLMEEWPNLIHTAFEDLTKEKLDAMEDRLEKDNLIKILNEEMPPHEDESVTNTPILVSSRRELSQRKHKHKKRYSMDGHIGTLDSDTKEKRSIYRKKLSPTYTASDSNFLSSKTVHGYKSPPAGSTSGSSSTNTSSASSSDDEGQQQRRKDKEKVKEKEVGEKKTSTSSKRKKKSLKHSDHKKKGSPKKRTEEANGVSNGSHSGRVRRTKKQSTEGRDREKDKDKDKDKEIEKEKENDSKNVEEAPESSKEGLKKSNSSDNLSKEADTIHKSDGSESSSASSSDDEVGSSNLKEKKKSSSSKRQKKHTKSKTKPHKKKGKESL
ncbi:G domain-containing protein [Balamuthia mandrillaris]